jgi:hypothetical protein
MLGWADARCSKKVSHRMVWQLAGSRKEQQQSGSCAEHVLACVSAC